MDGRRGRVFSIRLTDADRAIILEAATKSSATRYGYRRYGAVPIGPFIEAAALKVAREILSPPTPAAFTVTKTKKGKG